MALSDVFVIPESSAETPPSLQRTNDIDETPFSGGGDGGGEADAYEPDDPEEYVI